LGDGYTATDGALFSFLRSRSVSSHFAVFSRIKKPPAAPINLNTASSEETSAGFRGIGPVTAEKNITECASRMARSKSVDDPKRHPRHRPPKRLEKMRKYLTVGKATSATKPVGVPKPGNSAKSRRALPLIRHVHRL